MQQSIPLGLPGTQQVLDDDGADIIPATHQGVVHVAASATQPTASQDRQLEATVPVPPSAHNRPLVWCQAKVSGRSRQIFEQHVLCDKSGQPKADKCASQAMLELLKSTRSKAAGNQMAAWWRMELLHECAH